MKNYIMDNSSITIVLCPILIIHLDKEDSAMKVPQENKFI